MRFIYARLENRDFLASAVDTTIVFKTYLATSKYQRSRIPWRDAIKLGAVQVSAHDRQIFRRVSPLFHGRR